MPTCTQHTQRYAGLLRFNSRNDERKLLFARERADRRLRRAKDVRHKRLEQLLHDVVAALRPRAQPRCGASASSAFFASATAGSGSADLPDRSAITPMTISLMR